MSLLNKVVRDGYKVTEVPFHFGDRNLGNSKIAPMAYIVDVLKYVIVASIKEKLFGSFGKFLVVGGTGFIIQAVILRIMVGAFRKLILQFLNLLDWRGCCYFFKL